MKPKSKKDQFVIKMNNGEEVKKVKDYYCADNNDSWIHFNFAILHDDIGKYSMLYDNLPDRYSNLPVISFEEWESLPDVPKPEYDPKDVAFKNDYSNYEFNSKNFETKCGHVYTENKPIIGYKLIKPEYKEAVSKLIDLSLGDFEFTKRCPFNFTATSEWCFELKEMKVLDLFFEPVYDTSITLKSGVKLSEDDIAEVKEIIKIRQVCKDLAKEKKC